MALLAPAIAHANTPIHSNGIQPGSAPPVIDGSLGDPIWSSASTYTWGWIGGTATVRLLNDGTYLYIGFSIDDGTLVGLPKAFYASFDSNLSRTLNTASGATRADDRWYAGVSSALTGDWAFDVTQFVTDVSKGGTDGLDWAANYTSTGPSSGTFVAEMRHRLCDPDVYDVCIQPGLPMNVYGINFNYLSNGALTGFPDSGDMSPANWGDLQFTDNINPTDSWSIPSAGATVSGITSLAAFAQDNVGVTKVEFYAENAPGSGTYTLLSTATAPAPAGSNQYIAPGGFDTTTRPNGTYKIKATAYDAAGNTADTIESVIINNAAADTTPPTVQITYPPGGSDIRGTVGLTATATDNVAVDHVTYEYFDGALPFHPIGTSSTPPYAVNFDTTVWPDRAHNSATIYATAYDTSGNVSTKYGVGVGIDNTPPIASLTAPRSGAAVSGTLVFGGNADDPPAGVGTGVAAWSFEYALHTDGSPTWSVAGSATGSSSGAISGAWDTASVANGTYDVSLKVVDNAGNITRSAVRTITIDNSSPDSTLKIDAGSFAALDPAVPIGPSNQVLYATCAKLVNYPDVDGQAGLANLLPEVASALPSVSADGTTYTFTLNSGWKFSNGEDVTPQAFIHAIERDLSPALNAVSGGYGQAILGGISGAQAYIAGTSPNVSGLSASGNQLTIVLTAPDKTLLARLATSFGCAVPPSTPLLQVDDLPSAGPYYVASYVPGSQLILDVNPNYAGARPHAFTRLVFTLGRSPTTGEGDVKSGAADYAATGVPFGDIATLDSAYGGDASPKRFFTNPMLVLRSIGFNTRRLMFAGAAMRHAVAVALDRTSLAAAYPGSSVTDQLLPPGMPGFQNFNIYPTNITDFSAAATAVRAAGFAGATAVVYVSQCGAGAGCNFETLTAAIRNSLARVGLQADIHTFSSVPDFISAIHAEGATFDIATFGWGADYADPFDFLNTLLDPAVSGNAGFTGFNDPTALANMRFVANLNPPGRYAEYSKTELMLSQQYVPMTGFAVANAHDFFTARIGCQTYNPLFGMDLAALCVAPQFTASVALNAGSSSVTAGGSSVALASVPQAAISGAAASSQSNAPLDTIPLDTIPLDTIPLDTIPLDTIPLDTIGINATTLAHSSLGTIPLDTIQLPNSQRWETLLSGTVLAGAPINTLSLLDVANSAPSVLHALHLHDLANSPLDTIPLAAATLTTVPLDTIPIQGHSPAATDWCNLVHAVPGFAAYDCSSIATQTVLGLAIRGVPLDTIPLDTIPLDTIDLRGSPLDTIPLDTIPLNTLQNSPLDTIPLDTIDFTISPLDTIPLDTIPAPNLNLVVQCGGAFTCPGHTLGDAAAAHALQPGATLGQIGTYPGVTLGNLGRGLPPNVTLHDLLALLLGLHTYDWEKLPLDFPIQDYSTDPAGAVKYSAPFSLTGTGGPQVVTLTATLTNGERYVPGSTDLSGSPAPEPKATASGGIETVTWTIPGIVINSDGPYTLHFTARSGLTLGTVSAQISLKVGAAPAATSGPTPVNVTDTFEPNNTADTAHAIDSSSLYLSYITSATDRDFYTIPVPSAGTATKILLSHLPADYDLIVYGPAQQALRAAPLDTIPLDTIAANDAAPTLQQQSQNLSPESLQDVPANPPAGQSVLGVSDVRGTGDEEVNLVSTGGGGNYTIEVVGFNGAMSPKPYMLRTQQESPRPLPACVARTMGSGGTAGAMPAIPANVDTLFLINQKQFGDLNGAGAETQVVSSLNSIVTTSGLGFVGAVIPVESDPTVAANYATWNQNPCDPALANNVARSIISVVDGIRSTHAGIKNVVIVGGDDQIPMTRLADPTPLSNEANYASTFGFNSNNEFVSSFADHYLMSDDPYANVHTTTFAGGQLYVPDQAVGRLVDTPLEIVGQINQFINAHGQLSPSTELTTGYDFLADGATAEAAALKAPGRTTQGDLISFPGQTQWNLSQLTGAMFPASGTPPAIMAINAHYNQSALLPADQNALHRTDVLYTAAMLAAQGPSAVQNRLALTLGCHSGVNAPDTLFSGAAAQDWAQTYVGHGAFGFIGNTGYGLGDTVTVAYSEQLHVDLAKRLDGSLSVGQALAFAKQDYVGGLGQVTSYDAKVINESTLYGLPMWRIGTGVPPAPPTPVPTFTDPGTGQPAQSITVTPTFTRNTTAYGTYFTVNGESVAESRRPIEPSTSLDVTEPNLNAHGFLITSLTSTEEAINAAFSRPVNDSPVAEPELTGLITYPTKFQALRAISTPNGQRQRLVLTVGQYVSDGIPNGQGTGTQVKFTSVGGRVIYADPSVHDFTPPGIGAVTVDRVTLGDGSSNVAFTAPVTDETGNPANDKRVLVLYQDGGTWRSLDLARTGTIWSGAGPVGAETSFKYIVQAVDQYGNIGVTSDKGDLAPIVVPQQSGGVTFTVSGTPTNGWFTTAVDVTFTAGAGVTVQSSLDGSMFQPTTGPVHVDGSGVHTLLYTGSDGSSGTVIVPIDETPPAILIGKRTYVIGSTGNSFDFVCSDAGSGVASCTPTPAQPDTSSVGTKSFSVHAVDRVGNATDATGSYQVVWPFRGFFQPISNLPFLNVVNAGQAVPVKFSLVGNRGLSIFAANYPQSVQIGCDSQAPLDTTVPTVTAGASSLSYDSGADQYIYVWKTDKSWGNTCRQLDVRLADGTDHVANFKFK